MRRYTPAGLLISRARSRAAVTQCELAAMSGVAAGRISEYERGRRDPTVSTMLKLLAAAGCTIELAGVGDATYANPYLNAKTLMDVLGINDAMNPPKRPESTTTAKTGTYGKVPQSQVDQTE